MSSWRAFLQFVVHFHLVYGSAQLSFLVPAHFYVFMCFPDRCLHCCGFVSLISIGCSLHNFSWAYPAKSEYCDLSPLSEVLWRANSILLW
jgi:hypothetical protein